MSELAQVAILLGAIGFTLGAVWFVARWLEARTTIRDARAEVHPIREHQVTGVDAVGPYSDPCSCPIGTDHDVSTMPLRGFGGDPRD